MPLRPSGLQPETPIYIGDLVVGDFLYVNIRTQQVLIPEAYQEGGIRKIRWVIESMRTTKRGTSVTQAQGPLIESDVDNELVVMSVGARSSYRNSLINKPSTATIPWSAIQVAYITRPRIEGTPPNQTYNVKFPRKIPVSFTQ